MIPWYLIKYYLHKHSKFCTSTAILLFLTIIFYSHIQIFLAAWSFLIGIAVAHSSISSDTVLPNILFMYGRKKKVGNVSDDELTLMKTVCTVCGQRRCPRHRPELNILAFQPWTYLEVRKPIDEAIEEFGNIVLKEFMYTWYRDLSSDEEFADDLKQSIRFLASVLLRRAKKIDIPKMISEKLVVAALYHLHNYLDTKKHVPAGSDIQQMTLERLGPNMHVALQSRKSEVEYLRRLVETLFPYILTPQALKSRCTCALVREMLSGSVLLPALDAVANPDMVNNLLLIFMDNTPPPPPTEPPSPYVPFLENFAKPLAVNQSCFHLKMKDVLSRENTTYLYPFMQFLKNEAAINVLQFNLSCEDFNTRILSPELSQGELVELHNMAKDLYKTYCSPNAQDRIKFDEQIVEELQKVVEGPPDQVITLRTSTPLFKAYDHSYNLLENTFLPLFHQSDPFYTMLCGNRDPFRITKSQSSNSLLAPRSAYSTSRQPEKKSFAFSNIGTKIKGVFKGGEVRSLPEGENFEDADRLTIASCSSLDDEISETLVSDLPDFTVDLSTWRVSIPRVGARPEPDNMKKQFFVFIIDVRRADMAMNGGNNDFSSKDHWSVARRYHEFYVLESKLAEFHGDLLQDCLLPPKKIVGTGKQEFIEGKKELFEQYLQKLLTKPFLKGSQLLCNFLTSEDQFTTGFLPDISLGKMFKSGAMKLVKEKGKHLESFLQTFEQSTIASPPRSSKPERRGSDASMKSTSSEKLCGSLYENNANYSTDSMSSNSSNSYDYGNHSRQQEQEYLQEIDGVYDILVYIARYVYSIPDWFHHLLMTGRILFKSTLENYLEWYIEQKIDHVTQEHRVVRLIHLLRDVLFFNQDPPRTDEEKRERLDKTRQGALEFIPKLFVSAVGRANHENGTRLLLEVLQQPKLNKQLSYVFLDIFVQELFPEIRG